VTVTISMLVALFGLRCVLMALTLGVAYAYSERVYEFVRGRQTEDRLGAAIWLFALGAAFTNINSGYMMIAEPGQFHGSIVVVFFGLSVITAAHYLALTAWGAYRFDLPIRRVTFHSAAVLAVIGTLGCVGFSAFLWNVGPTIGL